MFSIEVMRKYISDGAYDKLRTTIDKGIQLDISIANEVAEAMKKWAVEKGATHFTHWFQPLTGVTAEKLDSFIYPNLNNYKI